MVAVLIADSLNRFRHTETEQTVVPVWILRVRNLLVFLRYNNMLEMIAQQKQLEGPQVGVPYEQKLCGLHSTYPVYGTCTSMSHSSLKP